ncbi:MAG: phosphate ABC transporter permease subunit PstC [Steroidobacteraceae bacterium]|jgi:phosphate transport system permease protein|nr:phosphate ABC transporter permease subunit PstC [Steroidobacteraceae bacterium]
MPTSTVVLILLILSAVAYQVGRARSLATVGGLKGARHLHSLPGYYGLLTALWCAIPALLILALWSMADGRIVTELVVAGLPPELRSLPADQLSLVLNDIKNIVAGAVPAGVASPEIVAASARYAELQQLSGYAIAVLCLAIALGAGAFVVSRIQPALRARNRVEAIVRGALVVASSIAILTTIGIVLSVLFESIQFFRQVPVTEFLFGLNWSPQLAIRADQVGSSGAFGAVPLFTGTLLIAGIAMLVAVPVGLFSAIYLAEYAHGKVRAIVKPMLEVLAGIPTVVYGFFAALVVAPNIRGFGESFGLEVSSESALAAGLVMGIMIIPFVSSLADDMITAVPQSLRDGSYGLGATQSETIRRVVLPAALPGIVGGVLLAISRAIGETMIVVMAAGLGANLTANPLEAVTTVTTQIVTLLVGDQEFDSPKTLAAFALGLVLFVVTLSLNIIALHVVRKYREQYE